MSLRAYVWAAKCMREFLEAGHDPDVVFVVLEGMLQAMDEKEK